MKNSITKFFLSEAYYPNVSLSEALENLKFFENLKLIFKGHLFPTVNFSGSFSNFEKFERRIKESTSNTNLTGKFGAFKSQENFSITFSLMNNPEFMERLYVPNYFFCGKITQKGKGFNIEGKFEAQNDKEMGLQILGKLIFLLVISFLVFILSFPFLTTSPINGTYYIITIISIISSALIVFGFAFSVTIYKAIELKRIQTIQKALLGALNY